MYVFIWTALKGNTLKAVVKPSNSGCMSRKKDYGER